MPVTMNSQTKAGFKKLSSRLCTHKAIICGVLFDGFGGFATDETKRMFRYVELHTVVFYEFIQFCEKAFTAHELLGFSLKP